MFERFRVDPSTLPPLPGRQEPVLQMPFFHRIFGDPIDREIPGTEVAHLALGCFWGAEKLYWNTDGVRLTGVGYQGGTTPNPTYEEACSGRTGHAETVRVVFDPSAVRPPPRGSGTSTSARSRRPVSARSPRRSCQRLTGTGPRTTTSSIWRPTPTATAPSTRRV